MLPRLPGRKAVRGHSQPVGHAELRVVYALDVPGQPDRLLDPTLPPRLDGIDLIGLDVVALDDVDQAIEESVHHTAVRVRLVRNVARELPLASEPRGDRR